MVWFFAHLFVPLHTDMKEDKPLVSFILTYYNLPVEMLCQCIDSILALSLQPSMREILVIDDGSEVSPLNSLMQYGNDITYVWQKNGGVSMARNKGLQMAQGQYIQFVDGDDSLICHSYNHCLDIIRRCPDADAVLFDFTHGTQAGTTFNDEVKASGSEYMRNHNLRGAICCCLFRQSVRGSLTFTPGIQYGEDEEFTPQLLLRAETIYATDAKAYYYRERETSAVHKTDKEHIKKRLDDTATVIHKLHLLEDRLPSEDRLAIQRRVAQLTMDYLYNTALLTRSATELSQRAEALRAEGLFPLPDHDYSIKYKWFRRLTNSQTGLSLLVHLLPLLKKER